MEELATPFERVVTPLAGHAKPLNCGNADGPVEHSWPHFPALADINLPEPPIEFLGRSNVEHVPADVNAFPDVAILGEGFAGEARAASDVEDEGPGLKVQQFNGPFGNVALDVLDSRVGLVLGGLVDVIVEIRWKLIFGSAAHYINNYNPMEVYRYKVHDGPCFLCL